MKSALVLSLFLMIWSCSLSQGIHHSSLNVFSDTIVSNGNEYSLMHYHLVSEEIKKKILNDRNDSIFNNQYNSFSRLIFKSLQHSFDLPTIPLNHIIYLKDKRIIIGLSKITISPYQVVIYTEDGKLIFKEAINQLALELSKSQINDLINKHTGFLNCLLQTTIVRDNEIYQIPISQCILREIDKDSIIKMGILIFNPYFPLMNHPTDQQYYNSDLYYDFFSDSDPLYDLVMIGSVPFLLILNSESGEKVSIPLVSNCNILSDIKVSKVDKR